MSDVGELLPIATSKKSGLMPKSLVFEPNKVNTDADRQYVRIARFKLGNSIGFTLLASILKNHQANGDLILISGYCQNGTAVIKSQQIMKGNLLKKINYIVSNGYLDLYVRITAYSFAMAFPVGHTTPMNSDADFSAVIETLPNGAEEAVIS